MTLPAVGGPTGWWVTVPSGAVSVNVCIFEKARIVSVLPAACPTDGYASAARSMVPAVARRVRVVG